MSAFSVIDPVDCIAIQGRDARRFAQAQFSGDVDQLAPGHWQWNAWLDPKGRVRLLMQLTDPGDGRLLAVVRGGDAAATCAALARFVFRSDVRLETFSCTTRAGQAQPQGSALSRGDVLALGLGDRSLCLEPQARIPDSDAAAQAAWTLADIRAGWPTLTAVDQGRFLPPALGLERLGAVSYRKGCYPGQEIAARLHFRGGHKHRLCHLQGSPDLARGEFRDEDGVVRMHVLDVVPTAEGCEALAILPVDIQRTINNLQSIYRIVETFAT